MQMRFVISALVGGFLFLVSASPALAQAKVDFSAGYQFLSFLQEGGNKVPTGWGASVGVGKEWVKFVGDVGGHYENGVQLHTFQGGVEFSSKGKRVVPFVRALSGVVLGSSGGDFDSVYIFTPEGGVKFMANDHIGVQTSVGFPIFFDGDGSANGFRFFAGVVIRK